MLNRKLFKQTFLLLFVVGVLNFIGDVFYVYWILWWFDNVLHFLAGATVAMSAVLACNFFMNAKVADKGKIIIIAILSVLVVGIAWEVYELYFGLTSFSEGSDGIPYVLDTTKDIVVDVFGGILGSLYGLKVLLSSK